MFKLSDTPSHALSAATPRLDVRAGIVFDVPVWELLPAVYKIKCPSWAKKHELSIISGLVRGGAPLPDTRLCWGSVDGFRLAVMRKEWLDEDSKEYYDNGDGEWFVSCCVINGMEKSYAVALRTALLRALKLPLNGDRPIEAVEKTWQASWNTDAVHREAESILAGHRPQGVEIRYTGQTQPHWWLPPALQEEAPVLSPFSSLKEKYEKLGADPLATQHRANERQKKEEADRKLRAQREAEKRQASAPRPTDLTPEQKGLKVLCPTSNSSGSGGPVSAQPTGLAIAHALAKGPDTAVPLTGGLTIFDSPPVKAKAKPAPVSPDKPSFRMNNTGGF